MAEIEALHAGAGLRYERPVGGDHARAASILEVLGQRRPGAGLPGQIGAAEATLAHAVATLTGLGRSAEAIGAARAAWLRDRMAPLRAWAAAQGLQGGLADAARSA